MIRIPRNRTGRDLDIRVWGPNGWGIMHSVALGWDPEAVPTNDVRRFYESIVKVLPCPECRSHGQAYVQDNPVDTRSQHHLCRWVSDFHNTVNVRRGKKTVPYDGRDSRNGKNYKASLVAVSLAVVLIAAALMSRRRDLRLFTCK